MDPKVENRNRRVWNERKGNYPYRFRTEREPVLDPRLAECAVEDVLLYVPMSTHLLWGFKTQRAGKLFLAWARKAGATPVTED